MSGITEQFLERVQQGLRETGHTIDFCDLLNQGWLIRYRNERFIFLRCSLERSGQQFTTMECHPLFEWDLMPIRLRHELAYEVQQRTEGAWLEWLKKREDDGKRRDNVGPGATPRDAEPAERL